DDGGAARLRGRLQNLLHLLVQVVEGRPLEEFVGRVSSRTEGVSIARMVSPAGWGEPGQTPRVRRVHGRAARRTAGRDAHGEHVGTAGQATLVSRGEWVRDSTPGPGGAEYVAVCIPAFSPDTVHREA